MDIYCCWVLAPLSLRVCAKGNKETIKSQKRKKKEKKKKVVSRQVV
jgi:hypothetical protein